MKIFYQVSQNSFKLNDYWILVWLLPRDRLFTKMLMFTTVDTKCLSGCRKRRPVLHPYYIVLVLRDQCLQYFYRWELTCTFIVISKKDSIKWNLQCSHFNIFTLDRWANYQSILWFELAMCEKELSCFGMIRYNLFYLYFCSSF